MDHLRKDDRKAGPDLIAKGRGPSGAMLKNTLFGMEGEGPSYFNVLSAYFLVLITLTLSTQLYKGIAYRINLVILLTVKTVSLNLVVDVDVLNLFITMWVSIH